MQYDLTGIDPEYLVSNRLYRVFQTNQIIQLPEPAFMTSLEVIEHTQGGNVTLTKGTSADYWVREEDYDIDAMSEAKIIDSTFDKILIKSFVVIKPLTTEYEIGVNYQKLRSSLVDDAYREGVPVEYSQNLMAEVITSIRYLEAMAGREDSAFGGCAGIIDVLDEDRSGIKPENLITDERHTMDVPNHKRVISPAYGSFYKHDLTLKLVSTGATLVENTDYIIIGANLPKTRTCDHPSGVFDYIYIVSAIVGDIDVTYHAYGGEVTPISFNSLRDALKRICLYLVDTDFLTASALPYNPYIVDMNRRIVVVEDWLRGLDASVPQATFTIAPGNEYMHWYTIAHMYKRRIDDPPGYIYFRDDAHFRLKMHNLNIGMDFIMSNNSEQPNETFDLKVSISTSPGEKVPIDAYKTLPDIIAPSVRIIRTDDIGTGMLLQIGVSLRGYPTEDIVLENHSGKECEWYLTENTAPTWPAEDNNVMLPDGVTTWVQGQPNMVEHQKVLGPDDGILIWAGSQDMQSIRYPSAANLTSIVNLEDYDVSEITSLGFTVLDRAAGKTFTIFSDGQSYPPDFSVIVNNLDFVGIVAQVAEVANELVIHAFTAMGQHSLVNERYYLLQVYARFN